MGEHCFVNGFETGYAAGRRSVDMPTRIKAVVDEGANIPTRAHNTDAGLDLYATKSGWILPKNHKVIGTGFHCAIPSGWVGMLTSKSGLMAKGITSRGTIDCGYTGEIKAVLFNHSWKFIKIHKGQKITQLVLMPIATPSLEYADTLEDTERAGNGFGSTGR
jgi:dUTP pyrophosphatase